MKIFRQGFVTGLVLQLSIGPVFFFILNIALQRTVFDGLVGALAVALVDYFYITLTILGIGKLLKKKKNKKIFGCISSVVLMIFGVLLMRGIESGGVSTLGGATSMSLFSSFASVFFLDIASPMTMVFFTSLFIAKATEHNYKQRELFIFGLGVALAPFVFMGVSVILFSLVREAIPVALIHLLNVIVGCLLMGYGGIRFVSALKQKI